jgi:hypothetical protein
LLDSDNDGIFVEKDIFDELMEEPIFDAKSSDDFAVGKMEEPAV